MFCKGQIPSSAKGMLNGLFEFLSDAPQPLAASLLASHGVSLKGWSRIVRWIQIKLTSTEL